MIAQETSLLQQTQIYAESLLKHLTLDYTYHNLSHTRAVVAFANEIADHEKLSDTDRETVIVAAWLHDVGYKDGCDNHEANGIHIARPFLEKQGLSPKRIEEVEACIQATKMPQNPQGKRLAEVLCDADLGHLSTDDFLERSEDLRQEMKHTFEKISKKKWRKKTADFLENHHYFTHYGKTVLEPRQLANLEKLRQQLADDDAEDEPKHGKHEKDKPDKDKGKHHKEVNDEVSELTKEPDSPRPPSESKPADSVKKERKPERGVETMFRLTSANHFQLSSMADTKANIMISINTIVLSLIVSILARKLEEWPILTIPTIMLAVTCLVATVLSVLATRPNVTSGFVSREDIENKTANLLFFGNFHQMGLPDYEWGMRRMMDDSDFLYSSMIRDIYFLGKVLGRKYKLLRWSYSVFMFGLVISVIAFGIATYMSK